MKESRKGFGLGQPGPAAREKSGSRSDAENQESEYLDGQMLIAMPVMEDERLQLNIIKKGERIMLGEDAEAMKVLRGGPVETGRGFVLHSSDFFIKDSTLPIDDDISLTATLDILKAIATGSGPKRAILALGYAGWGPGQLENELQHNGWLHCPADPDLVFGKDVDAKYERALKKLGIELAMLSNEAGHE